MEYRVDKQQCGSYRWSVVEVLDDWPHERHVLSCETKQEATALSAGLAGYLLQLRSWYRLHGARHGWENAAQIAYTLGIKPIHVAANPNTYEPLS